MVDLELKSRGHTASCLCFSTNHADPYFIPNAVFISASVKYASKRFSSTTSLGTYFFCEEGVKRSCQRIIKRSLPLRSLRHTDLVTTQLCSAVKQSQYRDASLPFKGAHMYNTRQPLLPSSSPLVCRLSQPIIRIHENCFEMRSGTHGGRSRRLFVVILQLLSAFLHTTTHLEKDSVNQTLRSLATPSTCADHWLLTGFSPDSRIVA